MILTEPSEKVDVLIVDDRLDGLIALEAILDFPHINLVKAQSGREALDLLDHYDFAVILLDVQMPELDGFQTADLIRKNVKSRLTPIIFVTAINKDDRYIGKGYEAGAVDYIFKPFDPQILRSKIKVFIDLFVKSRQLQEQAEFIRESERRERYLKLAELELENLKRYRNLADSIPHIVWRAGAEGTLDYFNRQWTEYTGLSVEQSVGSGWQVAIDADDLREYLRTWIGCMTAHVPFEAEVRIRRHDGEMRWHWMHAVPDVRNGQVTAWLGTGTDIHDRKLTAERLVDAEKLATAANVEKTQFLANMSHEIRTPLNAILGFTELMLNPQQTAAERLHYVSTVRRSGRQLLRVIDEILDISKVEAGHLDVECIEVNMTHLLNEVRSLMRVQANNKSIELDIRLETPIPEVIFSDPTRLMQILLNIMGNAIKFTDMGRVSLVISWADKRMSFRVKDTGLGIETGQIAKLFKPFSQVDTSTTRRFGGTGLGLALSKKLAEALSGDVSIESSAPGKGSVFLIEIEAEPVPDSTFISSLEFARPELVKSINEKDKELLKGIHVLLVDDAPDNQALISRFLTYAGAQVEVASNGQEGVNKALAGQHEVVLMDIQMPFLDGYEATSQLRTQGYERPIIALTAHALKEERERCLKAGCSEHMTKPIDRRLLIEQVARFAKKAQAIH